MPQEISGALDASGRSFAIVVARFNEIFTRKLMEGAVDALLRHGAREDDLTIVWVPGAFEVPLIVRQLAESSRFDAVIGLALVVKGDTNHHEVVTNAAVQGVAAAALATGVPCPLGIVTVESTEQAIERCGSKQGNRGWDAAMAAMEMVNIVGWALTLEIADEDVIDFTSSDDPVEADAAPARPLRRAASRRPAATPKAASRKTASRKRPR